MLISDLDFELPAELIAQRPSPGRDDCRLLRLRRAAPGQLEERTFDFLPEFLLPGDVLVRNVTRVIPARLQAVKEPTGARCELLLLEPDAVPGCWWALGRPGRRLRSGTILRLADATPLEVRERDRGGRILLAFPPGVDALQTAQELGEMPLPPYIHRAADAADVEAYQTVYARVDGSVAAPTAGLHFTPELLSKLAARGIGIVDLVLHVGLATFQPIRCRDPLQHPMHWERFSVERAALARLDAARAAGGRAVAVGTTVTRALESVAVWERGERAGEVELQETGGCLLGRTRLYIHPPFEFRRVDALVTNFHLPRSSLLLLVDAFAGREAMRAAYAAAISRRFRFFSYGDAMLIE